MNQEELDAKRILENLENSGSSDNVYNTLGKIKTSEEQTKESQILDAKERLKSRGIEIPSLKTSLNTNIGYQTIPLRDLPTKGRFLPLGTSIQIRPAKTKEIEHWTTMNELDPLDADFHLNDIVSSCTIIQNNGNNINAKSLNDGDKWFLALAIKGITFSAGENDLILTGTCELCGEESSKNLEHLDLVQVHSLDDELEKYYSEEHNCYVLKTKSYGNIHLHVPNIGVMEFCYKRGRDSEMQGIKWNKSFFTFLPYMTNDYIGLSKEKSELLSELEYKFSRMTNKQISLLYKFCNKIRFGTEPKTKYKCNCEKNNCQGEVTASLSGFSIKDFFLISDFSDELL